MSTPLIEDLLRPLVPQVLGALTRKYGDFDVCEDAVQEALIAANQQWRDEVPDNPRAWLITVASRRLIDMLRSNSARSDREQATAMDEADTHHGAADDELTLMFMCCHPALTVPSQIALTLTAVGGLTIAEVARAFMIPLPTMAQRIVRAKRTLKEQSVSFALPSHDQYRPRLQSVLHVLYLIYTEGHTASAGEHLQRQDLSREAIRLTRHAMRYAPLSSYVIQAAIAAAHAQATSTATTDWPQITALYRLLGLISDNPMETLGLAVALSHTVGPLAGLEHLRRVEGLLAGNHRMLAVRAYLREQCGDVGAIDDYAEAAARTTSLPERRYLEEQVARLTAAT